MRLEELAQKPPEAVPGFSIARLSLRISQAVSLGWGLLCLGFVGLGGVFWGFVSWHDNYPDYIGGFVFGLLLIPWIPPTVAVAFLNSRSGDKGGPHLALAVALAGYLVLGVMWAHLTSFGMPIGTWAYLALFNYLLPVAPLVLSYPLVASRRLGASRTVTSVLAVSLMLFTAGCLVLLLDAPLPRSSTPSGEARTPSLGKQLAPTAQPARPTSQANAPIATMTAIQGASKAVFGPSQGIIVHPSVGVGTAYADKTARHFVAEARFYTPSSFAGPAYNFGFKFREASDGAGYYLYYTLRGTAGWYLVKSELVNDILQTTNLGDWQVGVLSTKFLPNEVNHLRLMVDGRKGFLVVNGVLAAEMELLDTSEGRLALTASMLGESPNGARLPSTRYDDFTVWQLP